MGRREELETGLAGLPNTQTKTAGMDSGTPNTIFKLKASKRPTI